MPYPSAVPLFYFNLYNDMDVPDEEGTDLPDAAAACVRAAQFAVDMSAASIIEQRKLNLHHRIEVADESGTIVCTVEFGDVLKVVS